MRKGDRLCRKIHDQPYNEKLEQKYKSIEIWQQSMGCQVGKKHLLFTYMAIKFSLMDVIFYHIGTI